MEKRRNFKPEEKAKIVLEVLRKKNRRIRGDIMTLETKRLILREWNENDVEDLIEGLNNIEVSKWLAFVPYPFNLEILA